MPGHVYWLDTNNVYLGCNDIQARDANLPSRKDIIGKTNKDLPWHEQADELNAINSEVINTGIAQTKTEYTYVGGKKNIYLSQKVPLYDKNNKIIGLAGISVDITELKRVESELILAKDLAETANKAKQQFLKDMRHDIRTPLSGIVGFSEVIKYISNESKVKECADNLIASSHALLHLLDEVLEAIRVSSGEIPMLKKKFNLKDTFEAIIALYSPKAQEKGLKFTLNYDSNLPRFVIGDKVRLHRIVLELVANALNFTDRGHVTIEISLPKRQERNLVLKLVVKDSGMGIPRNKQDEIYLQFKRLTPSYEGIYKGAGLGLFVVKQFIDELEGEIHVASAPKQGSCFTCLIPLKESLLDDGSDVEKIDDVIENAYMKPAAYLSSMESSLEINEESKASELIQILLVEDNITAQKAGSAQLSLLDAQVTVASSGQQALILFSQYSYDLIFMDIGLGDGIDGYEVTSLIRSQEKGKEVPIIALTAHEGDDNKQRCIETGMNAVLNKPLTITTASNTLQAFIPARRPPIISKPIHRDLPETNEELFQLDHYNLFDLEDALQHCHDQKTLIDLLTTWLNEELPKDVEEIKEAFAHKEYGLVEKTAHRMKGGAVYIGTIRMKYACQYLERYWKSGERELFPALYKQAIEVIEETAEHLKEWLDKNICE
jgi:signal transduction histidine kinase/CheY-like chemotaxis protein/HPt (histidine-containing phosphotransfer) domain-containing protein